jgi:hypothetical protein
MLRFAVLALAILASPVAAATEQFDLVCKGTRQATVDGPLNDHARTLRVDLTRMEFCRDECDAVHKIDDVRADRIILNYATQETTTLNVLVSEELDRIAGNYTYSWIQSRPVPRFEEIKARCEVRPFSGFPATKF